jgi:hypothetical protein
MSRSEDVFSFELGHTRFIKELKKNIALHFLPPDGRGVKQHSYNESMLVQSVLPTVKSFNHLSTYRFSNWRLSINYRYYNKKLCTVIDTCVEQFIILKCRSRACRYCSIDVHAFAEGLEI